MAQISRLRDAQITDGNVIYADDLDTEFNQLVNESNSQDTRLTSIESSAMSFTGQKTFTNGIKTDTIDERTTANGVTIDSVVLKDGYVAPVVSSDPATAAAGSIWYNSTGNQLKLKNNLEAVVIQNAPTGYMTPLNISSMSTSTFVIKSGFSCRSSDDTVTMTTTADKTINFTTSGANGRDTGSATANVWYYVYCIENPSTQAVDFVCSQTNEKISGSITLPSGYTKKRQLPLAFYTLSTTEIRPFTYVPRGGGSGSIVFQSISGWPAVGGVTILTAANPSTGVYTQAFVTTAVPHQIARNVHFSCELNTVSSTSVWQFATNNFSGAYDFTAWSNNATVPTNNPFNLTIASDGSLYYARTSGASTLNLRVRGFDITETF